MFAARALVGSSPSSTVLIVPHPPDALIFILLRVSSSNPLEARRCRLLAPQEDNVMVIITTKVACQSCLACRSCSDVLEMFRAMMSEYPATQVGRSWCREGYVKSGGRGWLAPRNSVTEGYQKSRDRRNHI